MNHASSQGARSRVRTFGGLSGIAGVLLLITSFSLLNGPGSDLGPAELVRFGHEHFSTILVQAWLQAVAPILIALFAFVLVHLSGATSHPSGWMTFLGFSLLLNVSMLEVAFYIAALFDQPAGLPFLSIKIISAIQHLYFVVAAPTVFLPLGIVLLKSKILPQLWAYSALGLAAAFATLGIAYMSTLVLPRAVTAFASVQALWWLTAAVMLIVRRPSLPSEQSS